LNTVPQRLANMVARFGGHVENGKSLRSLFKHQVIEPYRTYVLLHEASLRLWYQLLRHC
jgi:hypothetical protein